ncbi:flagellar basal body-associated FliL family protein [Rhabdochromatium marinum]|uniref:flagellar basal body-associated FliL family protein n=1 Tax=Rhabdochromatium marinum TaxID=48729 RepID=UPI001903EC1B|nr:flagellar basal body-associated FliL family protein [Rhabdochromatium marinum]MBK1649567.1 hypothetical protein [Rhabdochromatium marinum]
MIHGFTHRLPSRLNRRSGSGKRSLSMLPALLLALLLPLAQLQAQPLRMMNNYPGYVAMGPYLIVNLADPSVPRFLRVEIDFYVLTADDNSIIQQYDPAVRDKLISLYGGRDMDVLQTPEGREELRKETLEVLRELLTGYADKPAIEDLYFTAFIMQ